MALAYKILDVKHTIDTVAEDGTTTTVDLSERGQVLIVATYVDTAQPNAPLISQPRRFVVPASETEAQISERIMAYGRMVRDARTRSGQLRAFIGQVVTITAPPADPGV